MSTPKSSKSSKSSKKTVVEKAPVKKTATTVKKTATAVKKTAGLVASAAPKVRDRGAERARREHVLALEKKIGQLEMSEKQLIAERDAIAVTAEEHAKKVRRLAHGVLSVATIGDVGPKFWVLDGSIKFACETLGVEPRDAREYIRKVPASEIRGT